MALVALVLLAAACGAKGPAICGNGAVELGEECDDGNRLNGDSCTNSCRLPGSGTSSVFLHWTIAGKEIAGFSGETCPGVQASQIRLDFEGAESLTQMVDCSFMQFKFENLAVGDYTVHATLLDATSTPVTRGQASVTFTVTGGTIEPVLDIPFSDFTTTLSGNFFFTVAWAGATTCDGAAPAVTQQELVLERGGQTVAGMTDNGQRLDGTPGVCRPAAGNQPQVVNGLTWGPAKMTVTGLDADGTPRFRGTYDTFVGAGIANPVMAFDVDSLAPDAGVPDAARPDAAAPDAGLADAAATD